MNAFQERIRAAQRERQTRLCLSLDIVIADTPLPIQPADEPMLPFARAIIEATADLVCAFQIRPTYFLAEGGSGMIALERIVRLIPDSTPLIIDLRLDDAGEAALAARAAFYQYKGSAVTARPELPESAARASADHDRGGQGVLAVLDGAPLALTAAWHGFSVSAKRTAEAVEARRLNPAGIALVQHSDGMDTAAQLHQQQGSQRPPARCHHAGRAKAFARDRHAAVPRPPPPSAPTACPSRKRRPTSTKPP